MEDGDVHPLLELLFDVEALGGLDVFEVHAAQRRLHGGDHVDQLVRVVLGQFDVEDVDSGEFLEQAALAFHHRLGGQRPDIAQAKDGGAVGNDANQIGARGQSRQPWQGLRRSRHRPRPRRASRPAPDRAGWSGPWSGGRKSCPGWATDDIRLQLRADPFPRTLLWFSAGGKNLEDYRKAWAPAKRNYVFSRS